MRHSLKAHFSLSTGSPSRGAADASLHFAAHSHHPWPDVSRTAQAQAWDDAARLLDGKWGHVFGNVLPEAQRHVARVLHLPDPSSLVFAPNTHDFVVRLFSCFPAGKRLRILASDAEFHSFTRQTMRLEEEGLAEIVRVPAQPHESFAARFVEAANAGVFDLAFVSHVFFNSGFIVPELPTLVAAISPHSNFIVIDGYHGFMAVETDLSAIAARAFYLAGGYKYAMAGEGVCFMHCPPGFGPRPRDTGWYAEFGALEKPRDGSIGYGSDGSRFAGATFDPSGLYRLNAVMRWQQALGIPISAQHAYVQDLQQHFLEGLGTRSVLSPSMLAVPEARARGRFLTFITPKAAKIHDGLAAQRVMTDYRADRLRVGFGVYHDVADVEALLRALNTLSP